MQVLLYHWLVGSVGNSLVMLCMWDARLQQLVDSSVIKTLCVSICAALQDAIKGHVPLVLFPASCLSMFLLFHLQGGFAVWSTAAVGAGPWLCCLAAGALQGCGHKCKHGAARDTGVPGAGLNQGRAGTVTSSIPGHKVTARSRASARRHVV